MLRGQAIVCVSSIDWDFLWQQHQTIMSAFARAGNQVLFIENTGVRSARLSDTPRILRRIRARWHAPKGFRRELPGLDRYSPVILPLPYSRVARSINRRILVAATRTWLRSNGAANPILWTFLPTRVVLDLRRAIPHRLFVYYCTDNFAATSPDARRVVPTEIEILRTADLVFAMSRAMVERARRFRDTVVQIPMGVSAEIFEPVRDSLSPRPEDLAGITPPMIGYVGGIRATIDKALVARIAREHPEWTLVFVGPIQMGVSDLRAYGNIRFLGQKAYGEIPRYIRAFDCCILPYLKTPYTDSVSPAKLHEYLIMGKPVVSTSIAEVAAVAATHADPRLVYVASDHDQFIRCIAEALAEPRGSAERRIAVGREQAWESKIETIIGCLERALAHLSSAEQ